jgi:uncharacterized protein YgiM (DUF1202 family)
MKRMRFVFIAWLTTAVVLVTFSSIATAHEPQQIFERPILVVNTGYLNVRTGPSAEFGIAATVAGGTELTVLGTAGDEVWYQVVVPNGQVGWVNVTFTIPRGDFTNVPLANTDASPASVPFVPAARAAVAAPPAVSGGSGDGFLPVVPVDAAAAAAVSASSAPAVAPAISQAAPAAAPVIPPAGLVNVVIVNTSALNVRIGPGPSYVKLFTASGGTQFPALGITPDRLWYLIQAPNQVGWVNAEFVIFRGDPNAVPIITYESIPDEILPRDIGIVVVNTSFLNVRSGPGAQYTQIFTARGGTELPVLGLASDGVWYFVQTPAGQGWVNTEYVLFRGDPESVPVIPLAEAGGILQAPVAVIGSSAQLYAAPGTNFGLLGSVAGPVEAPIVARTAKFDWVQINTSVGFGWVLADQVIIRGDASLIPIVSN